MEPRCGHVKKHCEYKCRICNAWYSCHICHRDMSDGGMPNNTAAMTRLSRSELIEKYGAADGDSFIKNCDKPINELD